METIERLTNFLRGTGVPNFLVVGIVVIVIWLLISGIRKGFRRRNEDRNAEDDEGDGEK